MAQESPKKEALLTVEGFLANKKWVERFENLFGVLDTDKDGLLTINDFVPDIRKFAPFSSDPEIIERCRLAFLERANTLGVKPGISVNKEEFVKNFATTAEKEIKSVKRGEGSLVYRLLNAMFDLVGSDPCTISLTEFQSGIELIGITKGVGEAIFNSLDTKGSGKLEKIELIRHLFNILFSLDQVPGWAEMYAALKPK